MFDESSGQVFNERIISRDAINDMDRDSIDWSRRRPYPAFKPRGPHGPRPLIDMATRVVADNIGRINSPADLDAIPNRLLWRVWRFLEARSVVFPSGMFRYLGKH